MGLDAFHFYEPSRGGEGIAQSTRSNAGRESRRKRITEWLIDAAYVTFFPHFFFFPTVGCSCQTARTLQGCDVSPNVVSQTDGLNISHGYSQPHETFHQVCRVKGVARRMRNESAKCEMFRRDRKLLTAAATQICDRNTGKGIHKRKQLHNQHN